MDPTGRHAAPQRVAVGLAALALATAVGANAGRGATTGPDANVVAAGLAPELGEAWHPVVPQPVPTKGAESTSARCSDRASAWLGMRWQAPVRWRVNRSTIPDYLGKQSIVVNAVRSAATTVSTGRNDCGLAEDLGMRQRFDGSTGRVAGITSDGRCSGRDGHSVVSFGQLRPGTLAVTCVWWYPGKDGGRSVEADILVDGADGAFFLDTPPGCLGQWDLESTLTHEFGHVFGLGHVPYANHGELTMSDGLPDCSTAYRGLGLGEYLALRARYGER